MYHDGLWVLKLFVEHLWSKLLLIFHHYRGGATANTTRHQGLLFWSKERHIILVTGICLATWTHLVARIELVSAWTWTHLSFCEKVINEFCFVGIVIIQYMLLLGGGRALMLLLALRWFLHRAVEILLVNFYFVQLYFKIIFRQLGRFLFWLNQSGSAERQVVHR